MQQILNIRKIFPFLLAILALFYISCETEVENHTRYGDLDSLASDSGFVDTFPPMKSPRELSASDTVEPPALPGNFTEERAMELVYGLYDKKIECSQWVCTVQEKDAFAEKIDAEGRLYSRSAGFYPFETESGIGVFLVTETLSRSGDGWESCHSCAPILGAAEFTLQDDEWVIKNLKKDLGQFGAWGTLPEKELVRIGPEKWGILFHEGYTSMGITTGNALLMGESNQQFRILADFQTEFSNEGFYSEDNQPDRAYQYGSEIRFDASKNEDFFPIVVRTSGTRPVTGDPESDQIMEFEEKRLYTFKSGKYVMADSTITFLD